MIRRVTAGFVIGYIFGSSSSIWLVGKYIEKDNGSFKATLLGSMIGGIVSGGIIGSYWYIRQEPLLGSPVLSWITFDVLTLTGGILGGHLIR